ncbi:UNVERIFIED_CONTAM: hypothetical protein GTU68_041336 [Idotea baltica]|nr:hypothetical protein [Idotea baltica]
MEFLDHVSELRNRLIYVVISIIIGSVLCYFFSGQIFNLLSKPYFSSFSGFELIGTGPAEAFLLKIKVAIFSGLILASPFIFFQLWKFIEPGLHNNERKLFIPFILFSSILFLIGVIFCYWIVLPLAFKFFEAQYASIGVTPTIRISEHLSILIKALLGFGIIFELPVLSLLLAKLGVIDHKFLIKYFRHSLVIIFILSAFLTPPDVLSQFLMAGPLIVLYGVSILLVKYSEKDIKSED